LRAGGSPETVIVRTLVCIAALLLFCACTSLEGPTADTDTWTSEVKQGTEKVASATARGAKAVGSSIGTAYRGVSNGFEDPASKAYGPFPKNYVAVIRKHMIRFEEVDPSSGFEFGQPARAYLNKGLLRGGDIEWQGWIVDVSVKTITAFGQTHVDEYVVRMAEGEVVEVMEARYAGALKRVTTEHKQVPASRAR
jgi:hypothetical protein